MAFPRSIWFLLAEADRRSSKRAALTNFSFADVRRFAVPAPLALGQYATLSEEDRFAQML
jgi:hypothetical protein